MLLILLLTICIIELIVGNNILQILSNEMYSFTMYVLLIDYWHASPNLLS